MSKKSTTLWLLVIASLLLLNHYAPSVAFALTVAGTVIAIGSGLGGLAWAGVMWVRER